MCVGVCVFVCVATTATAAATATAVASTSLRLLHEHPDLGGQARDRMHTMENLEPTLPEEHPDIGGQARGLEPTCNMSSHA